MGASRTHYAFLNISANFAGYFLNTVLGFICRIIFVKYLTVDYLGLNGLFSNIISMLSLTELGLGGVIGYTLYKPLAEKDYEKVNGLIRFFSRLYNYIGVTVAVLGLALLPFLDVIIKDPPQVNVSITHVYLLFLFSSALTYFFSYKISLLRASQKDYLVTGTSYIITIAQTILQIIVLILTRDYLLYIYIQVISGIIYLIWISIIVKKQFPLLSKSAILLPKTEKKKIYNDVSALAMNRVGGLLVNSTDNIIISYLINIAAVGLLSNYLLITKTLESLIGSLVTALNAGIGNYNATQSKEETLKLFKNIQFLIYIVYGLVTLLFLMIASDIITLMFGNNYIIDWRVVFILAVNFYMVGMQSILWSFKNSMGLFNYRKYLLLVTAVINLILSFYLGKIWGVFGVLMATTVARLLTNWWYDPIVVFKHGFSDIVGKYFKQYFIYLIILIVTGLLSYYLVSFLNYGLVINILLKLLITSCVYFIVIFLIFRNTEEYKFVKYKMNDILSIVQNVFNNFKVRYHKD